MKYIEEAMKKLEKRHVEHIKVYGEGNELRMTTRPQASTNSPGVLPTVAHPSEFPEPAPEKERDTLRTDDLLPTVTHTVSIFSIRP